MASSSQRADASSAALSCSFDQLALAHVLHITEAERMERIRDGAALRVEHAVFQCHRDPRLHAARLQALLRVDRLTAILRQARDEAVFLDWLKLMLNLSNHDHPAGYSRAGGFFNSSTALRPKLACAHSPQCAQANLPRPSCIAYFDWTSTGPFGFGAGFSTRIPSRLATSE